MSDKTSPKKKESFKEQTKAFFATYFLALLIRTFIVEASQIPSQSMVPSLLVGDILMVEKVSLGTYIPVLNIKMPSFSKPKVNDMVVFVSPEWKSPGFWDELITFLSLSLINKDNTFDNPKILVKRIVAGPGDILTMTNKTLYYNEKALSDKKLTNETQIVFSGGRRQGRLTYTLFQESSPNFQRVVQYSKEALENLNDNISLYDSENASFMFRSLVGSDFPQIRIPEKDKTIIISNLNIYEKHLLSMLIQRESKKETSLINGKVYQNNTELNEWTPSDDYYFMMGDNRDYSEDSRYFGYVAKKRIYGRVLLRYWPLNRFTFNANLKSKNI